MRSMIRHCLVLLVCGSVAACADTSTGPEERPAIEGRWVGTAANGSWVLTFTEGEGGALSGGGSFTAEATAVSLTVTSGVYVDPDFSITFSSTGFSDINYSGTVGSDGETLDGTLNGSGFRETSLRLERE